MALLVAAASTAGSLGGLLGLGGPGASGRLDYARGPAGGYFPLTDSFLDSTLGADRPRAALPIAPGPESTVLPVTLGSGGSAGGETAPPRDAADIDIDNDNFATAYDIRGLPFTSQPGPPSTREDAEPTSCAGSGGTWWYRYTPRVDVTLVGSTAGSGLGTAVAVFTGTSLRSLQQLSCSNDAGGNARVTVAAAARTTYWIQLTRTVTSNSPTRFALTAQGSTSSVSVNEDGRPADTQSYYPVTSANGRFVAFSSEADLTGHGTVCVSDHHAQVNPAFLGSVAPGPCLNIFVRDLHTGTTALASPSVTGGGGNQDSMMPSISNDGRYVVYYSWASDLVSNDTNGTIDTFRHDLVTRSTIRVSVTSAGAETHDPNYVGYAAVSADGRYVAFGSGAPDLGAPISDGDCAESTCYQSFVHDTVTGATTLVSVDESGTLYPGDAVVAGISADGQRVALAIDTSPGGGSLIVSTWRSRQIIDVGFSAGGDQPNSAVITTASESLSADGRYITFLSRASNLTEDEDTNGVTDVFVQDLVTLRIERVSVASDGTLAEGGNDGVTGGGVVNGTASLGFAHSTISADGRYVAFSSNATNLVPGDTNGVYDVFLRDRLRGTTERVSVRSDGSQSPRAAYRGVVSSGGRVVAFSAKGFNDSDDPAITAVYARIRPRV